MKKFSLKKTPALIKRDIKCLFSSKARAEKRAEEDRQRARLEAKTVAQTTAFYPAKAAQAQEQAPQTPVHAPVTPTSSPNAQSPAKDSVITATAFDSELSLVTAPSTAITEYSSVKDINLPTTYGATMAYFEHWFKKQHPNSNIPQSERNSFRGVIIILTIALLKCFKEPTYSPLIGFRPVEFRVPHPPRVLKQILASLTEDRRGAQHLAEHLLSLVDSNIHPQEFLKLIGYAKTRITDHESYLLHNELHRLLCNDCEIL